MEEWLPEGIEASVHVVSEAGSAGNVSIDEKEPVTLFEASGPPISRPPV